MTSHVSLAELVKVVVSLPTDDASDALTFLGYELRPIAQRTAAHKGPPPEAEVRSRTPEERFEEAARALSETSAARGTSQAAFWRVASYAPLDTSEEVAAFEDTQRALRPDEMGEGGELFPRREVVEIVPWRRLWPSLQSALRAERAGREPDVGALVRSLERGEVLRRVPRVRRRAWAERASLWIDRSERLVPLHPDQDRIERRVRRVFRRSLEVRRLQREDHARARDAARGWLDGYRVDDSRPVVVLGDLGRFDGASTARWVGALRGLRAVGVRVTVLAPWRSSHATEGVERACRVVPWDQIRGARDQVDRLLTLTSAAAFVEPGLLRDLRRLLTAEGATVECELRAWNHSDVDGRDGAGMVLDPEATLRRREAFRALDVDLQARVREVIQRWHARMPKELVHAEALVWQQIAAPSLTETREDAEARDFACSLAKTTCSSDAPPTLPAVLQYARVMLSTMPVSAYRALPSLAAVWEVAHDGIDGAVPPDGVDVATLRARRRSGEAPGLWALRQVGAALETSRMVSDAWPSEAESAGSPVAVIETLGGDVVIERSVAGEVRAEQRRLSWSPSVSLRGAEKITVSGARGALRLEPWKREPWVVESGRDRFGLWAEVEVKGVRFRMRWIPPGRFVMGSPKGEAGRFDGEVQHEVVLTRGYWLGETPVTQALWEAVMGANPSGSKSADRPAESVSWDGSMEFVRRLNGLVPGLDVGLPTEAEWEYACRAGTKTATWVGDLTLTEEHRAKELDAIAWYYGNSGSTTHPVREKSANPWGVFDMLGNVLEWCSDWHAPYGAAPAVDPRGAESGSVRVLRGGSWGSGARGVRAARRGASVPGDANRDFGLRLARGQSALQGAGEKRGTTGGRRRMP